MLAQQVAKKYSRALFEVAKEKNLIDSAWEQFGAIAEYLKKEDTLIDFMTAPQVNDRDKYALIKSAFESRLEPPFYHFILMLVRKRRIQYLPDIIEALDELIREEKGIVRATSISAMPMTESERTDLIARLESKTAKKIELVEKIDKSLIGGIKVILQNQVIDGSLRYGLSQLKNKLMALKVH